MTVGIGIPTGGTIRIYGTGDGDIILLTVIGITGMDTTIIMDTTIGIMDIMTTGIMPIIVQEKQADTTTAKL